MLQSCLQWQSPSSERHPHSSEGSVSAGVWTASALICADSEEVLDTLTDPALIARWSPVSFDVEELKGGRLRAGGFARVQGRVAGVTASFDIEVTRADEQGLELRADGPVSLDVEYLFSDLETGVLVDATVKLRRRRGLTAQLLQAATGALLNDGALTKALGRLAGELDPPAAEPLAIAA